MRVWCLFIIMRMKISSFWLLLHTRRRLYGMCPSTCRWFCSQAQKMRATLNIAFRNWNCEFLNSLVPSFFLRVSGILTCKEQEITVHYLVLLQKWLDHLISSFHCFYFLCWRTILRGVHNSNGFREILSTWPDAHGFYGCNASSLPLMRQTLRCENTASESRFSIL